MADMDMNLDYNMDEFEEEGAPVLVKTYDGWGTRPSSGGDILDWEGAKDLEERYESVADNIADSEELSNAEKIERLSALKELWKNEF